MCHTDIWSSKKLTFTFTKMETIFFKSRLRSIRYMHGIYFKLVQ